MVYSLETQKKALAQSKKYERVNKSNSRCCDTGNIKRQNLRIYFVATNTG